MGSVVFHTKFKWLFWAQFLGALNDNVFKNALVLWIAFRLSDEAKSGFFINLASGLFILPFLLFSPIAGQICDKFSKSVVIFWIKVCEIGIMIMGIGGFLWGQPIFLICVLFLMGTHSAFFGPAKYSIVPQILEEKEIYEGTGLIEMGTFVAILIGTLVGGILIKLSLVWLGSVLLSVAVLGMLSAKQLGYVVPLNSSLVLELNPLTQFSRMISKVAKNRRLTLSVFAVSWFWFFGATILAQLPNFVKFFLHGGESIVTLILSVFTISIAVGSIVAGMMKSERARSLIVPIGSTGMSVFLFLLTQINLSQFPSLPTPGMVSFFSKIVFWESIGILGCIFMIGLSGGLFSVPLYSTLQTAGNKEDCSQVIAANNVLNSLFMVLSAILAIVLYSLGFKTNAIFQVTAGLNIGVLVVLMLLNKSAKI